MTQSCKQNSHLLPELWLSLLDCCEDHVAIGSRGQAVQTTTDAADSDDVQVLSTWKRIDTI